MPTYCLGALRFRITGRGRVLEPLHEEFGVLEVHDGAAPHLVFDFVEQLPAIAEGIQLPSLRITDTGFATAGDGLDYYVTRRDGAIHVDIVSHRPRGRRRFVPAALSRFLDWNYLTLHEAIAKNFIYDVFDYLSQLAQLPLGQSYLHASSVERDGRAIAIVGWGGVGKTSSMLRLVMDDGWRYLSDDLAAIDVRGTIWRSPKRLQIYGYNLVGHEALSHALLSRRSALDRLAWSARYRVRGPHQVRRRVDAARLFGDAHVAAQADLEHVFFIERGHVQGFDVTPLRPAEAARRAATTLLRELQPCLDLTVAMHSGSGSVVLPPLITQFEDTVRVLEAALGRAAVQSVRVPVHAGPEEVARYVGGLVADVAAGGSRV